LALGEKAGESKVRGEGKLQPLVVDLHNVVLQRKERKRERREWETLFGIEQL
jgi:hypothetical protein